MFFPIGFANWCLLSNQGDMKMKYLFKRILTIAIYNLLKLFSVYKIRETNILFISFDGKQISGCPLYIYEYINEKYGKEYCIDWVLQKSKISVNQRQRVTEKA